MAKRKDHGDMVEIRYVKGRDTLSKFRKVMRKIFRTEKNNLLIDLVNAPELSDDYLSSFVFGAQSLKTTGHTVTLMLSPNNYSILKDCQHAALFKFEIGTVISDEEISEMVAEQQIQDHPFFFVDGDTVVVAEEGAEDIPEILSKYVEKILQNHSEAIIDITNVSFITPAILQALLLETLNSGSALMVRILPDQAEVLEENPQTMILKTDVVTQPTKEKPKSKTNEDDKAFSLDFNAELPPPVEEEPVVAKASDSKAMEACKVDSKEIPAITKTTPPKLVQMSSESTEPNYKIVVNCLEAGEMTKEAFIDGFYQNLEKLFQCGDQVYVDISLYKRLEQEIAETLIYAFVDARKQKKKLTLKMLDVQKIEIEKYLPQIQIVERKEIGEPTFEIVGPRMEIRNVSTEMFLDKFPENFKKLLACGKKDLVVDVSHLTEFPTPAIELTVLCYLDAVGRGLTMTLRIRPEMEESFQKSGRGKSLPLEVIKPELNVRRARKGTRGAIDMDKIKEALQSDKLTEKVLTKNYASVHIESRGSFQNWEPAPIKGTDKQDVYKGAERRREKRYPGSNLEVAFGRGSLAKIAGRRYPLRNVSKTGACFTSAIQLSRGEPLRIKIYTEENLGIEIPAKVIWASPVPSQALFMIGVQFTNVSTLVESQLQTIIRKLYKMFK